jgi:apolipoprotein D and lipocalin family protein
MDTQRCGQAPVAYLPRNPTSIDMIANVFRAMAHTGRRWLPSFKSPPATVAEVDLDRFVGTWFEVARLPNLEADGFGQRGVDVTATYGKRPDGRISVQTISYNASARMRRTQVNGTVRPTNPGRSQLLLTFYGVIRGRLWVVGLDKDYRWALMGTPSRRRLWLIARSPRKRRQIDTIDVKLRSRGPQWRSMAFTDCGST